MAQFLRFALVIAICVPLNAGAKSRAVGYEKALAQEFASKMARATSFDELVFALELQDRDARLAREHAEMSKVPFVKPIIGAMGAKLALKFPKRVVSVDFRDFRSGRLYVNKREVSLDEAKTYVNFRSEVLLALMESKRAMVWWSFFVEAALAADPVDVEIANYVAALVASSSRKRTSL